jgi:DNA-binding NtrC family response regulator
MSNQFVLLIADKNRHVRDFLRREFESDGFSVLTAKDEHELLGIVEAKIPDLLIIDLDIPYSVETEILEKVLARKSSIPIVIYTLMTEHASDEIVEQAAAFLEKRGNNVDDLKSSVRDVLSKSYPGRFADIMGKIQSGMLSVQ